ncbi:MAG TPA: M20 family metallopeptidase [Candidatus Nanopelagicaceae bacterium]|nr:M20 family metallopeptidase [Candidatus Nanopelagicaceae bacterium]
MSPRRESMALPELQRWLEQRQALWTEILEELVRIESPSGDAAALQQCAEAVAGWIQRLLGPSPVELGSEQGVPHLTLRSGEGPGVLLLAHLDTVWGVGSFQPLFEIQGGRASGPGVFDMKGGVVIALAALAALRERGGQSLPVTLLCTGDEEVGSPASRSLIEREATRSAAVLVLEAASGQAVKVARKGVGGYRLRLLGRAAHAGLEPERGVNAVVELAGLVAGVAAIASPELGTTVTPTVFQGGQRTNVVPAEAALEVDVRFATAAEADRVDRELHRLRPAHPEAVLEVHGGANRPPLERPASNSLFEIATHVAAGLGWPPLEGISVGGGSDGNFTAALGVPTLDGLGAVGGNAHAAGEWIELTSLASRAALLAGCIERIGEESSS